MSSSFRRLFCSKGNEVLETENNDPLVAKTDTPVLSKLLDLEKFIEATIISKFQSLELKLEEKLKENQQNTVAVVEKLPKCIEQINNKLDKLQKKLQEVEEKVDKTLDLLEKKNILEQKPGDDLKDEEEKFAVAVAKEVHKVLTSKNVAEAKKIADVTEDVEKIADPYADVACGVTWKEHRFVSKTNKNLYPIDHPSLKNTVVKMDGDKLTYLEMYIAIRAEEYATVILSPVQNPGPEDYVFILELGHTSFKLHHSTNKTDYNQHCTKVLPEKKFGLFLVLIKNGTIYFYSNNNTSYYTNTQYLEEKDENLSTIKYFGFNLNQYREQMFLFDCTPTYEGALSAVVN